MKKTQLLFILLTASCWNINAAEDLEIDKDRIAIDSAWVKIFKKRPEPTADHNVIMEDVKDLILARGTVVEVRKKAKNQLNAFDETLTELERGKFQFLLEETALVLDTMQEEITTLCSNLKEAGELKLELELELELELGLDSELDKDGAAIDSALVKILEERPAPMADYRVIMKDANDLILARKDVEALKKKAENQLNALGKILTKQEKAINQRLLEDASFLLGLIETELNEIG